MNPIWLTVCLCISETFMNNVRGCQANVSAPFSTRILSTSPNAVVTEVATVVATLASVLGARSAGAVVVGWVVAGANVTSGATGPVSNAACWAAAASTP